MTISQVAARHLDTQRLEASYVNFLPNQRPRLEPSRHQPADDPRSGRRSRGRRLVQTELDGLAEDHPAVLAWDEMVESVAPEVGPQVRDLMHDAIARRLPGTSGA